LNPVPLSDKDVKNPQATSLLPIEGDIATVSGPNPPIKKLPVHELEIQHALFTLANKIQLQQFFSQ